jgi:hypothetical protein
MSQISAWSYWRLSAPHTSSRLSVSLKGGMQALYICPDALVKANHATINALALKALAVARGKGGLAISSGTGDRLFFIQLTMERLAAKLRGRFRRNKKRPFPLRANTQGSRKAG